MKPAQCLPILLIVLFVVIPFSGSSAVDFFCVQKQMGSKYLGDTLELPFFDDFSYGEGKPDEALWQNFGVQISNYMSDNPPSIGVAVFDALDIDGNFHQGAAYSSKSGGDTLTSRPINLYYPGDNSIWLSFFYQPAGLGDAPEEADSLVLDFYSPTDSVWTTMMTFQGSKKVDFKQVSINITDRQFLQKGFRFRFRNYFSLGTSKMPDIVGNCDFWLLDYIKLDKNRTQADTLYEDVCIQTPPKFTYTDYQQVPWHHYRLNKSLHNIEYSFNYRNNDNSARHLDSINLFLKHSQNTDLYELGSYNVPSYNSFALESRNRFAYQFVSENDSAAIYDITLKLVSSKLYTDFEPNNYVTIRKTFADCYAYDDGSAEAGYGLNGEGSSSGCVAVKYVTLRPDYIKGVYIWFNKTFANAQASYFDIKVWNCVNGSPVSTILTLEGQETPKNSTGKFIYFEFPQPVFVTDTFFIGWQKNSDQILNVGFDKNTTSFNPKMIKTNSGWVVSSQPGQVMIRPSFGALSTAIEQVNNKSRAEFQTDLEVFPNPASSVVTIKTDSDLPFSLYVYNLVGKIMYEEKNIIGETKLDVSNWLSGLYLIKSTNSTKVEKIIVAH